MPIYNDYFYAFSINTVQPFGYTVLCVIALGLRKTSLTTLRFSGRGLFSTYISAVKKLKIFLKNKLLSFVDIIYKM